jgi:Zn-finger nucleic acid-binding protein
VRDYSVIFWCIGYWVGKGIHARLISYKAGDNAEWSRIERKTGEVEEKLVAEQQELDKLQKDLTKPKQYSS